MNSSQEWLFCLFLTVLLEVRCGGRWELSTQHSLTSRRNPRVFCTFFPLVFVMNFISTKHLTITRFFFSLLVAIYLRAVFKINVACFPLTDSWLTRIITTDFSVLIRTFKWIDWSRVELVKGLTTVIIGNFDISQVTLRLPDHAKKSH